MKNHTEIVYLLDRSGSMNSIAADVVGGFKAFIEEQKKAGDNASFTLIQFDTQGTDTVYNAQPIKNIPEALSFHPRGGTPLLDAIGGAVVRTGERLHDIPESERPDKVVFVIHTDGQENSSREYKSERIKEMIQHQTDVYKWQFIFLSSDITAVNDATSFYGISSSNAVLLDSHNHGGTMAMTSSNLASYRSTGAVTALDYSDQQRKKAKKS